MPKSKPTPQKPTPKSDRIVPTRTIIHKPQPIGDPMSRPHQPADNRNRSIGFY